MAGIIDFYREHKDTQPTQGSTHPITSGAVYDAGYITQEQVIVNQAFPNNWRTNGTMSQLISDINADTTAVKGKSYLSTVDLSDLPSGMLQAEMTAQIMDELSGLGKVILFTITSSNTSPYHWEYTSAYGAAGTWRVWETTNNKVTSISNQSTDAQYPSAKCVYDAIGNIPSGGGIRVIKSTADWSAISGDGVECATLAELATVTGIAEVDLEEMFTSNVCSILLLYGLDEAQVFVFIPGFMNIDDGQFTNYVWFEYGGDGNQVSIQYDAGTYFASGWGSE